MKTSWQDTLTAAEGKQAGSLVRKSKIGAVAEVVGKGWRNLRLDQQLATGVGAPAEITPWKRIARRTRRPVFWGAWFDPIEAELRERVRGFLEEMIEQEATAALGRSRYQRGVGPGVTGTARARVGCWARSGR